MSLATNTLSSMNTLQDLFFHPILIPFLNANDYSCLAGVSQEHQLRQTFRQRVLIQKIVVGKTMTIAKFWNIYEGYPGITMVDLSKARSLPPSMLRSHFKLKTIIDPVFKTREKVANRMEHNMYIIVAVAAASGVIKNYTTAMKGTEIHTALGASIGIIEAIAVLVLGLAHRSPRTALNMRIIAGATAITGTIAGVTGIMMAMTCASSPTRLISNIGQTTIGTALTLGSGRMVEIAISKVAKFLIKFLRG